MAHPKQTSRTAGPSGASRNRARSNAADEQPGLDADEDEQFGADVANADLELDPGGVNLDTEETDETSPTAARIVAAGGEIDEEASEELGVDSVVGPFEAGVGGGLDEQEEARLGITDEEIAAKAKAIARKARRR